MLNDIFIFKVLRGIGIEFPLVYTIGFVFFLYKMIELQTDSKDMSEKKRKKLRWYGFGAAFCLSMIHWGGIAV